MTKRPTDVALVPQERLLPSEAGSLAREMGRTYLQTVRFFRTQLGRSLDEADRDARALLAHRAEQVLEAPPEQVSWLGLGQLMEHDPEQGEAVWEGIKAAARDELDSGHRAAAALEFNGEPWHRAQFLAVRQAFRDEWQPQGGVEDSLIDVLAQAHSAYLGWLSVLHVRTTVDVARTSRTTRTHQHWEPPRIEEAAAVEQASAMVDRFNKLFLRTLRALRDLRRYGPVIVQNPQQVNIGTQQLNTVQPQGARSAESEDGPLPAIEGQRVRRQKRTKD